MSRSLLKTVILTSLSLIAFAANSVLSRMALEDKTIDPSSFTSIRLLSGSVVLLIIIACKTKGFETTARGSWHASLMLFLYAICFSFAYVSLSTATGALILFASVQITMIVISIFTGTRLLLMEWLGISVAFTGFVYLILPGVAAPSLSGFLLMTVAGIGWGCYTLKGRGSANPLADTTYNFLRTTPLVLILTVITINQSQISGEGVLLALLSGGIASGIGYTLWYTALGGLTSTQAAVLQLLVPVIAALGGVIFVSETLDLRLIISATMVLGGIFMVILARYFFSQAKPN